MEDKEENKDKWNPAAGELAKQEAITRVMDHASEDWKTRAFLAVRAVCLRLPEFTSDDVWMQLEKDGVRGPHEKRALGGVLRDAAARGWCQKTDRTRPTLHAKAHRRPVAIWISRLAGNVGVKS